MKYTKVCEHCGRQFVTVTFWAKYCSARCKLAAWRKAKKQPAAAKA